jgi:hypothetical protein
MFRNHGARNIASADTKRRRGVAFGPGAAAATPEAPGTMGSSPHGGINTGRAR